MNLLTPALLLTTVTIGEVLSTKFNGPTAVPVVLHSGYLADTHEVAAARNAHLATLSHQSQGGSYGHHGHTNLPHVQLDGHIVDTQEVSEAKAEHFSAVAKARALEGYHHSEGDHRHFEASGAHNGYGTLGFYHGPLANPVVLHDGHIADTHEVSAAKAEHFAAIAKARAYGGDYNGQNAEEYNHYSRVSGAYSEHGNPNSYHGTLAKPVVLPSGYLADTHEVAHAKQHHLKLLHSSHSRYSHV